VDLTNFIHSASGLELNIRHIKSLNGWKYANQSESHKRDMFLFKVLGNQQAEEGLRMESDVIDRSECENQRCIVEKWVLRPFFIKFPRNLSQITKFT